EAMAAPTASRTSSALPLSSSPVAPTLRTGWLSRIDGGGTFPADGADTEGTAAVPETAAGFPLGAACARWASAGAGGRFCDAGAVTFCGGPVVEPVAMGCGRIGGTAPVSPSGCVTAAPGVPDACCSETVVLGS